MALREAVADTSIAFLINMPLNYAILWYGHNQDWPPWLLTIVLTTTFTVFAIVRKTYLRLHFQRKYGNGS